ncbi:MAG TPA: hypothetical protein VFQ36_04810 [Ktedonobacteraceae bacterium]|nr:hypothetical protein [Ktedonobacteraceae bacterium]
MNSPQFLALFSAVFLALAGYNLYTGYKRMRDARLQSVRIKWFKQINLLTGTEYLLLALVFILSIEYKNNAVPASIRGVLLPLYLFFLLAAAVLAGLVIRQGILNARMLRAQGRTTTTVPAAKSNGTSAVHREESEDDEMDEQQRAALIERRRERRRNAAAARRRRAGKA